MEDEPEGTFPHALMGSNPFERPDFPATSVSGAMRSGPTSRFAITGWRSKCYEASSFGVITPEDAKKYVSTLSSPDSMKEFEDIEVDDEEDGDPFEEFASDGGRSSASNLSYVLQAAESKTMSEVTSRISIAGSTQEAQITHMTRMTSASPVRIPKVIKDMVTNDYVNSHSVNSRYIKRRQNGESSVVFLTDTLSFDHIAIHDTNLANALTQVMIRRGCERYVQEEFGVMSAEMTAESIKSATGVIGSKAIERGDARFFRGRVNDSSKILFLFCNREGVLKLMEHHDRCSYVGFGKEVISSCDSITNSDCAVFITQLVISKILKDEDPMALTERRLVASSTNKTKMIAMMTSATLFSVLVQATVYDVHAFSYAGLPATYPGLSEELSMLCLTANIFAKLSMCYTDQTSQD